jgi:hypothetical protein
VPPNLKGKFRVVIDFDTGPFKIKPAGEAEGAELTI